MSKILAKISVHNVNTSKFFVIIIVQIGTDT